MRSASAHGRSSAEWTVCAAAASSSAKKASAAYQPMSVTAVGDGVQRWTWPISAVPLTTERP
jgi:hypothetical protein